jgi:soluble lytic murein transglycosylase
MKNSLIAFTLILFLSPIAYADIYQYVDEHGVVCYTDLPIGKKADKVFKEKTRAAPAQREASRKSPKTPSYYHGIVYEKAAKYKIDPHLVKAIIKTESNWNERAVSRKGAMGLMQLMPTTASQMKVYDPFNPEENIEGGTKYLRHLSEHFNGDLTLALAAYNVGPKAVERVGVIPNFPETKQYVNRMLSLYGGTLTHPVSGDDTPKEKRSEPIYKVILEDGTVLFTNSTFLLMNTTKF